MGKAGLSKLTTALASISFLLQIASIALPGWTVYIEGNTDEQHALFYTRTCKSLLDVTNCKFETFHEMHSDTRARFVRAGVSREKIAAIGKFVVQCSYSSNKSTYGYLWTGTARQFILLSVDIGGGCALVGVFASNTNDRYFLTFVYCGQDKEPSSAL